MQEHAWACCAGTGYAAFADQVLETAAGCIRTNASSTTPRSRDHFAIIPTTQSPKGLTEPEQKLYDLVDERFLAVFYPAAEFLETTRITRVEGEPFKSEGKVLVKPGWLAVYGKEAQTRMTTPTLAPVDARRAGAHQGRRGEAERQTKPPPRYTEATLLCAMEGAGKLVDDDELREAMAEKGLGTPATRAAIIEGLIYESYLAPPRPRTPGHRQGVHPHHLLRRARASRR